MFLAGAYEREDHSVADSVDIVTPTFDLTLDTPYSESSLNCFDSFSHVSETESLDLHASESTEVDYPNPVSVSFGSSYTPNIAIPSSIPTNVPELLLPSVMNTPPILPYAKASALPMSSEEKRRFVEKQRRLRRMHILKQRRALGLISVSNCRKVRYQQKQVTAMQKTRVNGKFSCSDQF